MYLCCIMLINIEAVNCTKDETEKANWCKWNGASI